MNDSTQHLPNECVVAVYASQAEAETAFQILTKAGLGPNHVSIVKRHVDPTSQTAEELSLGDDSLHDAAVGGALGGLAGVVGAATLTSVTGIGLVLMTGPLVALTGVIVGAFLGAMRGWGLHDVHIRQYEKLVEEGHVLIAVCGDPEEVERAEKLLRQTKASNISSHGSSSADSPEIDDRSKK